MSTDSLPVLPIDFPFNPEALRAMAASSEVTVDDEVLLTRIEVESRFHAALLAQGDFRKLGHRITMSHGKLKLTITRVPYIKKYLELWIYRTMIQHGIRFFEATHDHPAWSCVTDASLRLCRQQAYNGLDPDVHFSSIEDPDDKWETHTMLLLLADFIEGKCK